MTAKFIIAIDQSTTGTKALLVDREGRICHKCYMEHRQIFSKPGWVEHDPTELLSNTQKLVSRLMQETKLKGADIEAISVTNQRETVIAWNKITGKPVYNAIVWQCNRASAQCKRILDMGLESVVREKTGLPLSEFFSAAKLAWIMDNLPEVRELRDCGELLCGTVDSWLIWNMSIEHRHVTDYSNASRTQLLNLNELCWDEQLVKAFSLSMDMLPELIFSDTVAGHYEIDGVKIPIGGVIGDSHGALFAQSGLKNGLKVTYGTGSSIMTGTGVTIRRCGALATTVSYAFNGKVNYAVEGNINSTGATIKWLADKLELMPSAADAEAQATQLSDNAGVYFVPAFGGLGAPYWKSSAKAVIWGLSFECDKRSIIRAALESIAYQISDVVASMEEGGVEIQALMVDGKPTENTFLMQFQADICGKKIIKNAIEEASAYGSALMAGLATGFWTLEDIDKLVKHGAVIECSMPETQRRTLLSQWHQAVKLSIGK